MKAVLLVLSLILGLMGYGAGIYLAMRIGLWQHDNYMYYSEGPVGYTLGIAGAVLGLAVPWVVKRLSKQ
jgi:hypothetical protein